MLRHRVQFNLIQEDAQPNQTWCHFVEPVNKTWTFYGVYCHKNFPEGVDPLDIKRSKALTNSLTELLGYCLRRVHDQNC